jgi:hypothetical protein
MIGAFRIEAYVIASADGMLTDASGVQPASLHFEADQRHFKQGLDQAGVVVNGRHSQEGHSNAMRLAPVSSPAKALILRRTLTKSQRLWNCHPGRRSGRLRRWA